MRFLISISLITFISLFNLNLRVHLHLLEFALVVDPFLDVIFDVVEGEEVVVFDDAGLWLFGVDVLERLEDASIS